MNRTKLAVFRSPWLFLAASLLSARALAPRLAAPRPPQLVFDHTTVYARDLERSAAFYEKVMGFPPIREPFRDGKHLWFRIGEHEQLHVVSGAAVPASAPIEVHFAFRVASIAEFTAHLDESKVRYRSFDGKDKFTTRPDGVHQTYLEDPDGYWIEVNDGKL